MEKQEKKARAGLGRFKGLPNPRHSTILKSIHATIPSLHSQLQPCSQARIRYAHPSFGKIPPSQSLLRSSQASKPLRRGFGAFFSLLLFFFGLWSFSFMENALPVALKGSGSSARNPSAIPPEAESNGDKREEFGTEIPSHAVGRAGNWAIFGNWGCAVGIKNWQHGTGSKGAWTKPWKMCLFQAFFEIPEPRPAGGIREDDPVLALFSLGIWAPALDGAVECSGSSRKIPKKTPVLPFWRFLGMTER